MAAWQIPSNWRAIIEDESTLSTILLAYSSSAPPQSSQAMECLSQFASVRRSLFPNQETRQVFLTRLLSGIVAILRSQQGLGEVANFHEFCRLLSRVKSNFKLSEMVKIDVYPDLLSLIASFTVQSFRSCPFASNSVYYLLQLWSRMVTSVAYRKHSRTPHSSGLYLNAFCLAHDSQYRTPACCLRKSVRPCISSKHAHTSIHVVRAKACFSTPSKSIQTVRGFMGGLGAVKGEGESHLDRYVPEVTQTYIVSKLSSARAALQVRASCHVLAAS